MTLVHVPKENRNTMDNKVFKCTFTGYNDGMKGYKLWDPMIWKIVYSRDVVLREVRVTFRIEEAQMEKEPYKMVFELRNEEHD